MIYTSLLGELLYITIVDKLPFFGNFLLREYYYSPIIEYVFSSYGRIHAFLKRFTFIYLFQSLKPLRNRTIFNELL